MVRISSTPRALMFSVVPMMPPIGGVSVALVACGKNKVSADGDFGVERNSQALLPVQVYPSFRWSRCAGSAPARPNKSAHRWCIANMDSDWWADVFDAEFAYLHDVTSCHGAEVGGVARMVTKPCRTHSTGQPVGGHSCPIIDWFAVGARKVHEVGPWNFA